MITVNKTKKIGIWGFGVVGKSAIRFLLPQVYTLQVYDKRILNETEKKFCEKNNITIVYNLSSFLVENDYVVTSPGVNIDCYYEQYKDKWLSELDLFADFFKKKVIAITGSVGKTSVTTLLSGILLNNGTKIATGGNIGFACLNLIKKQKTIDYAVLEVSSFQLNYSKRFAADIAIMTNFSPNHLDWHINEDNYFKAKCQLFLSQKENQFALIPFNCLEQIRLMGSTKSTCYWFCDYRPLVTDLQCIASSEALFYKDGRALWVYHNKRHTELLSLDNFASITFDQNWLILCGILYIMGIDIKKMPLLTQGLLLPQHRLEKCGLIKGVTIYNDSKATTIASTIGAVNQLYPKPLLLILGGLSKGVNREPLIKNLKGKVQKIYCFGSESAILAAFCEKYMIEAEQFPLLSDVVKAALTKAAAGDYLLFSPAGSSYDLFKDYQDRGLQFKQLIKELAEN